MSTKSLPERRKIVTGRQGAGDVTALPKSVAGEKSARSAHRREIHNVLDNRTPSCDIRRKISYKLAFSWKSSRFRVSLNACNKWENFFPLD